MKYPKEQFELLVSGLKVIIPLFKLTKEDCLSIGTMHNLHFHTYVNYDYPIENGNVKRNADGERILPRLESFKLYPDGCNDNQIETAMKAAIKQIFI